MVEFCLTLFLSFPGCSHPGLVGVLPLPGVTAPVWSPGRFWLLGAGSRLASPLRCSLALVWADDSLPLVFSLSAEHFGLWIYGLAIAALPLVAMLAEGTLESPSVLVLAFHSSLFLVEGSSDGSAPGDRFLSPGRMCSFPCPVVTLSGVSLMDRPLLVSSVESRFWGFCSWLYRASWLAQGCIPLLRLLPYCHRFGTLLRWGIRFLSRIRIRSFDYSRVTRVRVLLTFLTTSLRYLRILASLGVTRCDLPTFLPTLTFSSRAVPFLGF